MKLQLSTLGILFLLIFSSIACTDKKPENESDSLLPPDTPVTSVLKGSFESKFIRYEKGRKFAGQTSEQDIEREQADRLS